MIVSYIFISYDQLFFPNIYFISRIINKVHFADISLVWNALPCSIYCTIDSHATLSDIYLSCCIKYISSALYISRVVHNVSILLHSIDTLCYCTPLTLPRLHMQLLCSFLAITNINNNNNNK